MLTEQDKKTDHLAMLTYDGVMDLMRQAAIKQGVENHWNGLLEAINVRHFLQPVFQQYEARIDGLMGSRQADERIAQLEADQATELRTMMAHVAAMRDHYTADLAAERDKYGSMEARLNEAINYHLADVHKLSDALSRLGKTYEKLLDQPAPDAKPESKTMLHIELGRDLIGHILDRLLSSP